MKKDISPSLRSLLVEIAAKHNLLLPENGVRYLVERDRESLIDALLEELSESGLGPDDEPNQPGIEIEEIIDFVGPVVDRPDASGD